MRRLEEHEKVFGIGLSKTGTSSLSAALNLLGVRSIHFPHDEQTFAELARGEYRLSILREYQSVTDTPVAPYFAQLDRAWPGSRFILTVRDRAPWLRSAESHWRLLKEHGQRADDERFQAFADFINACVYGCIYFNAERFSYAYDRHVRSVCEYFADRPDDLLVLDICGGDGWERLCPFLGIPAPQDVPFPHANRSFLLHQVREAESDLAAVIPPDATVILLDQEALREYLTSEYRILPFLEREGVFWGLPPDDATAVRELERLRVDRDAHFLTVASPSFWCLEHYVGFAAHLRSRYPCLLTSERMLIFDLRQ